MALPDGVTTCTVTAGVPVSHTGAPVKAFLSIEPSVFLVHTATGTPLVDFLEELDISEGVAGQFTLPHTDQPGFQDENGNAYTNWYYTARISYSTPSKAKTKAPKIKVFQLATGQTLVDLDSLPGGAPALPYTAPIPTVTSFGGRTGPVVLQETDLPGRLTPASLNATILDTGKDAFVGKAAAYLDPRDFANGPVATMSSGQLVNRMGYATPTIADGKISHTPPSNNQGGVYMQVELAENVNRIGCLVEFAANTTGTIALVLPQNKWVEGNFGPAGVHTVIQPNGTISTARYENTEVNRINKSVGSLVGVHYVELVVDRDRNAYTIFIDGVLAMETIDALATPIIGKFAIWEFFNTASATVVPAKLLAMWASSGNSARIPADTPIVANKLQAAIGVKVKEFTGGAGGVGVTYPIANSGYTALHADLKMTVQFPASGKLAVEFDCALYSTGGQPVFLRITPTAQPTLASTGSFNGHVHGVSIITGTPFATVDVSMEGWVVTGGTASVRTGGGDGAMQWKATPIE